MKHGFMKRLWLMLSLAAFSCAAAVPPAEKLLPADTLGFLTVPNWTNGQTSFSNSARGQLWADASMKGFKEKFFEKFSADKIQPLEKELGFKFADYLRLARGQFTIAVVPNGWDGRSEKQPGLLWLIDTAENSSQLKTNLAELHKKWTDSGRKMRTDKIRDVEFTTVIVDAQEIGKSLQKITPGPKPATPEALKTGAMKQTVEWVIGQSGSLLIVSDAAKDVEKVLALQSGVSVPALADQAAFAATAPMLRDAQLFAWINVKPIMNTLARKRAEPPGEQQSLFGALPTMEKVLNALGLSGVQTIAFNVQQSTEGSTAHLVMRVPESARKGLFNILAVSPKDASPPPFVPADAVKFSRWRIDLQQAWTTIETMLTEISPQYAGFSKLILDTAGKDRDPNFDFRKQLLANLGDDVTSYEKIPRGASAASGNPAPSLTLVGSKNAEQMAVSLRAVTSIFPPEMIKYSERDFLGRKIYSVLIPQMAADGKARPLTYAASGGYVAFSTDAATLEEYLRSGEGMGKSLRDFAGLNDAAQKVGGTTTGYFSFENQSESGRAAFDAAKKDPAAIASLLGVGQLSSVLDVLGSDSKSLADSFDVSLLPPYDKVAKYFHFNVSAVGVTPEQITFTMFAPTPPQLHK